MVGTLTPFGLDGPYAEWTATDAALAASGGFAFKAGIPEDSPLLPPGHLVDDVTSITSAFGLLCALYQREHTGAGQFVEVSANEAIAQICDWSLPNSMARIEAGFPAGEVRNGNGPVYPIFACKGGYVRLIILSVRQWHAMREWLGEPEFLQDPALDGFVARREISEHVLNPLLEAHFADLSMEEVSLEAQKRGIVCTPALTPADILTNEHFASRGTFVELEVAPGVTAPIASGYLRGRRPPGGSARAATRRGRAHRSRSSPRWATSAPRPASTPAPGPPLAGLRVMDFGHGAVGVEVGRRFAEYGAEVMKIESRTYTDFMRLQLGGETNPSFASSSRTKLGFGVNAKTPDGRALLHQLAAHTDLVIENNSTGTMDKLGIGFDALRAVNPALVMVSSQLMGSHGVWSWWRGYGPSTQPPGGLVHLWNYADRDEPAGSMSIYPDHVAGCLGAVASLAALVGRGRFVNDGVHIEVAQVETVVGMLGDLMAAEGVEPGSVVPLGNRSEAGSPWGLYRCAGEEEWVAITCRDDAGWQGLVAAMGAPAWADASLAGVEARRARVDEIDERIREWTAAQSKDAVARACQEHGVPAAPMLTGAEMTTDPQYVARGFAVEIDQPGVGPLVLDGPAFRGGLMVGPDIRPAPDLGEHTRRIARDLLGLDDAEIDRLLAAGVLETTPPAA